MRVTKESLTARIAELEAGPRSLKEDYYLAVMRELLASLNRQPVYQILIYGEWHDTDEGEFKTAHPEDRRVLYEA